MSDSYNHLTVSQSNDVLHVTINREQKRNALSLDVLAEIKQAFRANADDPSLKLAVLTGAGEKCFAAGGDLKELDSVRSVDASTEMSISAGAALDAVREFPLPVIALLNGAALGGGAELAMACDFRLAASHARIGFIQGTLHITTAWGGGPDLIERIGSAPALDLVTSARVLSAGDAVEIGVIDAVAQESLSMLLEDYSSPMLAREAHVLRAMKALRLAAKAKFTAHLRELETELFVDCWTHEAHWEAAAKILGK